ncbi:MAG: iron-sulfur cluster assembly scaffold protein [Desulfobacteraceae bacterium]|nr:iron-sulfur cluster assembly scaffold protein [Desulfobacteraceae bacterium]
MNIKDKQKTEKTIKEFDFWNDHSLKFLEMALKRDFQERVKNPDGYGKRQGECGDIVEFFLNVKDNVLETISYDIQGCLNTHACANTIIKFAQNRTIEKAWEIKHEDIIDYLETLPEPEHHCAELSVGAFYLALKDLK